MKSLAIASLALFSGSAIAKSSVQGNNNNGILGVDSSSSHMGNNHGILNVFGGDGKHNIAGNKGFVNVLPFHIVRDDDVAADDELHSHVQGNNNNGILGVDSSSSHMGNNHGILNVFGGDGKHNIAGNKGFVNVLPFHIVRDDDVAADDELFDLFHVDILNQKYDVRHNSGRVVINTDDELLADDEFFAFDKSSFDMSGNKGQVHFNTDTPVSEMKNMNLARNKGQITQTDSTGKTTLIEGGKKDVHPRNTTTTHPGSVHPGKNLHPHKPVKPVKPTKPVHTKPVETKPVETKPTKPTMPGMNDMDADMNVMTLAMKKMEVDMQPLNELKGFLAK